MSKKKNRVIDCLEDQSAAVGFVKLSSGFGYIWGVYSCLATRDAQTEWTDLTFIPLFSKNVSQGTWGPENPETDNSILTKEEHAAHLNICQFLGSLSYQMGTGELCLGLLDLQTFGKCFFIQANYTLQAEVLLLSPPPPSVHLLPALPRCVIRLKVWNPSI